MKIEEKISTLQWWILVTSYVYYELNRNLVPDEMFDKNCRQLLKAQSKHKKIKTEYSYVFEDFENSSGFSLYRNLNNKHKKKIRKHVSYITRSLK